MVTSYSTHRSFPAGTLLICGSDTGITEIKFCPAEDGGVHENRAAESLPPVMHQCMGELDEYFQGSRQSFSFPVAQQGTVFQHNVWKELQAIPYGATISYLELSKRLGDVKAIRAAAAANGKNRLAVVVPCHRVIGANKDLVGYAGGIGMKKWLLQHEARFAYGVQTLF